MVNQQTGNISKIERYIEEWIPDAKLWIPHNNRNIAFAFPPFGIDDYYSIGKKILKRGFLVPTGDYTASLVHAAFFDSIVSGEPEFQEIKETIRGLVLHVYNINFWTSEGVYVIQNLEAKRLSEYPLDIDNLNKRLEDANEFNGIRFSKDNKIRFAPKETYELGKHTPESLMKNGFVIASYGIEGAKKLGEVSHQFKKNPFVLGYKIKNGGKPEKEPSSLGDYGLWKLGLRINGIFSPNNMGPGNYCLGYAFAMFNERLNE